MEIMENTVTKTEEYTVEAPKEIKLDREDILALKLIAEKLRRLEAEEGRIKAEQQVLQGENIFFVQNLNAKYGVNMSDYSVDLATGVAQPRVS